jgi:ADP-L-glycero-D-manno-heptose 6-epimerase
MVILVTGYKGFVGKNILSNLLHQYITIDAEYFDELNPKKYLIEFLNSNHIDAIFHIGACSDTLNTDVNFMMERNYLSTKWLMDWCVENKKKMIYSSSASVYGVDNNKPSNLYGWSKMLGEDYVLLNGGIGLRYFNVYGPGEEHKGKMSSMIYQNISKDEVKLFPNKPKRDFVYIDDVVSANFYALDNYERLKGNWYEVGSGESVEFETIFDILGIPYSYLKESDIPKGYQFNTKSSYDRHMNGWKPNVNIYDGVQKYKDYLKIK